MNFVITVYKVLSVNFYEKNQSRVAAFSELMYFQEINMTIVIILTSMSIY